MDIEIQEEAYKLAASVVPNLRTSTTVEKGSIAILGSCVEYSRPPFYCAKACFLMGTDIVFYFCARSTSDLLKSMLPQLFIVPVLGEPEAEIMIETYLKETRALIIGPGLGREEKYKSVVYFSIRTIKSHNKPIIIDGDGFHFISQNIDIIKGYPKAILTPSAIEFSRLYTSILKKHISPAQIFAPQEKLRELCEFLDSVTLVVKGPNDHISDGKNLLVCGEQATSMRCGGLGDVLAAICAVFACWTTFDNEKEESDMSLSQLNPCMVAGYAACVILRRCNLKAFHRFGRSTTASDIAEEIPMGIASAFPLSTRRIPIESNRAFIHH